MKKTFEFQWHGVDAIGKKVDGKMNVMSEKQAHQQLTANNITPLSIKRKMHFTVSDQSNIGADDIINFTRNLSALINANLTLHQALRMLASSHHKKSMAILLNQLAEQLNQGELFSNVLQHYPRHFNTIYISLIRCAEHSGQINIMLQQIVEYLESSNRLKKRLKKALSYPATMISITLIIALLLLIFVIPQFKSLFDSYHAPLPKLTQIVLTIADFIRLKWWLLIGQITFIVTATIKSYQQSKAARVFFDKLVLRLPIYGNLLHKATLARMLQTLSVNYAAGVPLDQSLTMIATLSNNTLFQNAITTITTDIQRGIALSNAFESHPIFPPMLVQMMHVGEQTGSLEELLKKLAEFYQEDVDQIVNNLSSLIEPFMIVLLGAIIGCFVLAMYLPIFKLGSLF